MSEVAQEEEAPKGETIRLNFSKPESPFKKPDELQEKRLKCFFWGDTGTLKTRLSLQFPKPAILDLERGTELYRADFPGYEVLPATTADEVMAAVDWLLTHSHEYRTLVIDPITIYWESLQKKWSDVMLARKKGTKGYKYEFYEFQPKDWMPMKAEHKELIRKLLALDMNVVVTARQKKEYAEGGEIMRVIGETFDGEKSLPYLFDVILHLRKVGDKFLARAIKDRTGKLPTVDFETSYEVFERAFGKQTLSKKSKPIALATQRQQEVIRRYAQELKIEEATLQERLQAYGAETVDELTQENAAVIIGKLEQKLGKKPEEVVSAS